VFELVTNELKDKKTEDKNGEKKMQRNWRRQFTIHCSIVRAVLLIMGKRKSQKWGA